MTTTLLLLDVDSVLIDPQGYRVALRSTIDHFAQAMGQPPVDLTLEENTFFEACGITSEWDSAPMCVGALLAEALRLKPDLARPSVIETLAAIREAGGVVPRPDLVAVARAVFAATPEGAPSTATIWRLLQERTPEAAHPLLAELFIKNHLPGSPTTRVFQQIALGSARFAQTYGQPADFEAESALLAHDRPLLAPDTRDRLLARVATDGWGAAIYTARPSLPPADLPDGQREQRDHSPDADLAAEQLGLGRLPLIGIGRLSWLAQRRGRDVANYAKPLPVQALAAIGAAASGTEAAALEAAAALAESGKLVGPLAALAGQPFHVVVFEDSRGGIQAVRSAVELLRRAGLDVSCEAVGIAYEPSKREALYPVAGRVVDDVNEALEIYLAS
jgi:hypothetical protein